MSLSPTAHNTDHNIDNDSLATLYKETNVFFVSSLNALYRKLENQTLTPNTLLRVEQALPALNLLSWVHSNSSAENNALKSNKLEHSAYWSNRDNSFVIAGIGSAVTLQADTQADLPEMFCQIKDIIKHHTARFIGGIAFNDRVPNNEWEDFPFAQFILPEIEITYRDNQYKLAVNLFAKTLSQLKQQQQRQLGYLKKLTFTSLSPSSVSEQKIPDSKIPDYKIIERVDTPSRDQWKVNVKHALSTIKTEDLNKVVLSRESKLTLNAPLPAIPLLRKWQEANQKGFVFYIQNGQSAFLGNSPEQLYSREHTFLNTEAIAGTVSRGTTDTHDKSLEQQLINSPKLIHEHKVVVDYIAQQLEGFCNYVSDTTPLSIVKLSKIQHLRTPFKACLKSSIADSDIILKLHPTPAVCGYPLKEAMSLINKQESNARGWYAGLIGTVSENETEFCVAIRSVLLKNNTAHCYSGAGIVDGSDEASEWDELESKIETFLSLFNT